MALPTRPWSTRFAVGVSATSGTPISVGRIQPRTAHRTRPVRFRRGAYEFRRRVHAPSRSRLRNARPPRAPLLGARRRLLVGDVVTTFVGLHLGLAESNPIALRAIEGYGLLGMLALKGFAVGVGLLCRPLLPRSTGRLSPLASRFRGWGRLHQPLHDLARGLTTKDGRLETRATRWTRLRPTDSPATLTVRRCTGSSPWDRRRSRPSFERDRLAGLRGRSRTSGSHDVNDRSRRPRRRRRVRGRDGRTRPRERSRAFAGVSAPQNRVRSHAESHCPFLPVDGEPGLAGDLARTVLSRFRPDQVGGAVVGFVPFCDVVDELESFVRRLVGSHVRYSVISSISGSDEQISYNSSTSTVSGESPRIAAGPSRSSPERAIPWLGRRLGPTKSHRWCVR